ncbi:MAG: hypothetical protein KDK55_01060 [Chlamydiia bacterium]|nr:hypothetical protein [Chlamydiia bacterium]
MSQPSGLPVKKIEKMPNPLEKQEHACKITISCSPPNAEGKMEVEMTYDGDSSLAAFLLESARDYFDSD